MYLIDTLLFALLIVTFLAAMILLSIRNTYIFQKNSYVSGEQKKWVRDNIIEIVIKTIWIFGTVPLILKLGSWGTIGACAVYVFVAFLNLPKKESEPLALTGRVKRLLFTQWLLVLIIVLMPVFMTESRRFFAMVFAIVSICAPYFVLMANLLNKPVEKIVNREH